MSAQLSLPGCAPVAQFQTPAYTVPTKVDEDAVIAKALAILERRMRKPIQPFGSPDVVKAFCRLHFGGLDHESFGVLFLDAQNRLIEFQAMFRGTLTQTSVYPREVVKAALAIHAAAVVFTHNHPSGTVQPSRADETLTAVLKSALALVDVRVLDHIIVCGDDALSMAERGLL
jgi:DNA repair protein RadC